MKSPRLRTWLLLVLLAALLVVTGVALLVRRGEGVTVAGYYEQLRVGMTEAEVAAAVPLAPGGHTDGHVHIAYAPTCDGGLPIYIDYWPQPGGIVTAPHPVTGRPLRGKWWRGEDGLVIVFFGENGRVIERRFYPGRSQSWASYQWELLFR